MKGVILAAGRGSRLFPITLRVPKPLLPLANRLTLHYAFERLRETGVDEIALVVGENEPQMRAALGSGDEHGVSLSYVRQHEPQGLAHAVGCAREFVGSSDFLLYLGDAIYSDSLHPFRRRFEESGCDNLNLVKRVADPERFGVAEVDGELITRLVEKPKEPKSDLAMAGVYFFGPAIWDAIDGLAPSARGEYEITDAVQRLIASGGTVLAGIYEGIWFDTGTLGSFLDTNNFLLSGGSVVEPTAHVAAEIGSNVAVGAGARVHARRIENAIILPGSTVEIVDGDLLRALVMGEVRRKGTLADAIADGEHIQL